jgi:hypothetical protein
MKSTADWGRIMFDDEIGNNTNGIRFKYILSQGWFKGNGTDDEISVGKGTWYDVLYNVTVKKTGDIVAFNKQRNDFNYTEMYADIVFEIDVSMISGYVWLMLAGQGTTVFQLINSEPQYTFWQETLSGTGHTRHVRTYIMLDSFFRRWEVESCSPEEREKIVHPQQGDLVFRTDTRVPAVDISQKCPILNGSLVAWARARHWKIRKS